MIALSKEEIAVQLVEHFRSGFMQNKAFLQHRDSKWAEGLVFLLNIYNKKENEERNELTK